MVTNELHAKLETILKELEQEFIMLRFRYGSPVGVHNNEIHGTPFVGLFTVEPTRDKMFITHIQIRIADLKRLLHYPRQEITVKRVAALRQRYFTMVHRNRTLKRGQAKQWSKRSSELLAGKFLLGTFDKYISYEDRKSD
jgi:hypothetical protein